ncbi:hypothetical protein Ppa06_08580 [Planomonospora parontospora subsp. parontospora]|uniref:Uncharacterized protein n=2 Tax=Planomonospora parontospora TaxID=58119 RepID=A0AA37F2M3_9ACTN|nr:hypothetical protein GCM10010126_08030 [Planomonospora parontospora]GII07060.1 hypothetical protein Ppa06_08580 [Planomonospora parontospora subsp. parontospora]
MATLISVVRKAARDQGRGSGGADRGPGPGLGSRVRIADRRRGARHQEAPPQRGGPPACPSGSAVTGEDDENLAYFIPDYLVTAMPSRPPYGLPTC